MASMLATNHFSITPSASSRPTAAKASSTSSVCVGVFNRPCRLNSSASFPCTCSITDEKSTDEGSRDISAPTAVSSRVSEASPGSTFASSRCAHMPPFLGVRPAGSPRPGWCRRKGLRSVCAPQSGRCRRGRGGGRWRSSGWRGRERGTRQGQWAGHLRPAEGVGLGEGSTGLDFPEDGVVGGAVGVGVLNLDQVAGSSVAGERLDGGDEAAAVAEGGHPADAGKAVGCHGGGE